MRRRKDVMGSRFSRTDLMSSRLVESVGTKKEKEGQTIKAR
jgi:hypothetical protein